MPLITYSCGLDLGQAHDPSALAVLERTLPDPDDSGRAGPATYGCRYLRRWPLGTPYPQIVEQTRALMAKLPGRPALVVDGSGVGRPCVDLLRQARSPFELVPVTITGGLAESQADGWYRVSKVVLVSGVQVCLQSDRLKFAAGLPETPVLVKELQNYRVKITEAANETFSAREGEHDDLVLALALAVWWAERPRLKFMCV